MSPATAPCTLAYAAAKNGRFAPARRRVEGAGQRRHFPSRKMAIFFLISIIRACVLHRRSPSRQPMAKLSKKSRHPRSAAPVVEPAPPPRRAARRRIRGCGAFAFFLASESVPSRSTNFLPMRQKRSRPEMAPQRLEKIESAPGNGMVSEASKPQDLVHGRAADRALRLRAARMPKLTNSTRGDRREIFRLAKH